jgi:uncharacterized membrane protein YcaP (DUF421 family)
MQREMITEEELMGALCQDQVEDPAIVRSAYPEADGQVSVVKANG